MEEFIQVEDILPCCLSHIYLLQDEISWNEFLILLIKSFDKNRVCIEYFGGCDQNTKGNCLFKSDDPYSSNCLLLSIHLRA